MIDFKNNRIASLFGIQFPIIQGGMVWCSGWKLAKGVAENGGLGVIGAGSMTLEIFEEHLKKFKSNCGLTFGVNIPLLYSKVEEQIALIKQYKVPIVITSAGSPAKYIDELKKAGCIVVHVVSSLKFALKAQAAGVDAIVAEGFEAGGHNGREETTTLCLLEGLYQQLNIPIIAAGGIATGRSMAAAFCLGAEGVQVGTRFALSQESSAHSVFKQAIIDAKEGDTALTLKEITPVRLLKTQFYAEVAEAYANNASVDKLRELLGKGRSKKGIFEGDLQNGEMEIGQASAYLNKVETSAEIIQDMLQEFECTMKRMSQI